MSKISGSAVSQSDYSFLLISESDIDSIDESHDLFSTIWKPKRFLTAESENDALKFLSRRDLRYVLIGDFDIVCHENKLLRDRLVRFVKNGGIVVHACLFALNPRWPDLGTYFKQDWGLSWKPTWEFQQPAFLNPYTRHIVKGDDLPLSYEVQGVFLRDVGIGDAICVCPQQTGDGSLPLVPAALAKIGSGFIGYVGMDSSIEGSDRVILAMFGLTSYG